MSVLVTNLEILTNTPEQLRRLIDERLHVARLEAERRRDEFVAQVNKAFGPRRAKTEPGGIGEGAL